MDNANTDTPLDPVDDLSQPRPDARCRPLANPFVPPALLALTTAKVRRVLDSYRADGAPPMGPALFLICWYAAVTPRPDAKAFATNRELSRAQYIAGRRMELLRQALRMVAAVGVPDKAILWAARGTALIIKAPEDITQDDMALWGIDMEARPGVERVTLCSAVLRKAARAVAEAKRRAYGVAPPAILSQPVKRPKTQPRPLVNPDGTPILTPTGRPRRTYKKRRTEAENLS